MPSPGGASISPQPSQQSQYSVTRGDGRWYMLEGTDGFGMLYLYEGFHYPRQLETEPISAWVCAVNLIPSKQDLTFHAIDKRAQIRSPECYCL